ncbi:M48 family metalloprotease [Nonomuraea sp. NEAU-A123]|uniref:M48 family metalloprotease n=1 Tax=Nonomuraea sp. NEAU-A123 TaxID=2839649 RepID=UPI001BE3F2DE|nr:M48 family metalloprotease [Nonomuraea sp. NEAU-A123]MBT2232318.1 M48 family metalloprotease [Nonomuraea sp. NEAU-A123]
MTAAGEMVSGRRLNPFALPSSTTSRFLILITATIACSLYLALFLFELRLRVAYLPEHVRHAECLSSLRSGVRSVEPTLLVDRYGECTAGVTAGEALLPIGSLVVPALFALLLYAFHPLWAYRRGLMALAQVSGGEAHADLVRGFTSIAEEEAPGKNVRLLVDPGRGEVTGRALGLPRRHIVVLSMGLVLAHATTPAITEAVLRHELAHIRNRDVGIAHFTVAIWWSFLLTACVPALVATAIWIPGGLLPQCARLAAMTLVLWLARTAVLRAREHHADVRAGDTAERQETMAAAIETASSNRRYPGPLRFFSSHPARRYRLAVLNEPGRLLRLDQWEMFSAGSLAGLGFAPVYHSYSQLDIEGVVDARYFTPGLMFGLLISGVLVVAVWRASTGRLAGQGSRMSLWWASASFTVGVIAGQYAAMIRAEVWIWTLASANPLIGLTYCLVLLLIIRAFLSWAKACSSAWLAVSTHPRTITLAAVAVSAVVIGSWLGFWFYGIATVVQAGVTWDLLVVTLVTMVRYTPLVLTIALACAYLVAAGTRARPAPGSGLRLHLDDAAPVLLQRLPAHLVRASLPFAVACCLMAVGGFALQPMLTAGSRQVGTGQFLEAVYVTMGVAVGLLALAALAAGILVGGRGSGTWAVAHAGVMLLAAVVPMALVILGHVAVAECGWERAGACFAQGAPLQVTIGNYATLTYTYAIYPCLLLAGCGSLLRARRRPPVPEPRRGVNRPVVASATIVITLALAAGVYGALLNWRLTVGAIPAARMTWQRPVMEAANQPIKPGSVPQLDACRYALGVFASPGVRDALNTDQRYYVLAAGLINRVASSDDPALRAMAQAGYVWLDRGRADMVTKVVSRVLHYCVLVGGEHQVDLQAS